MNIFYTSDLHLGHEKIIDLCGRPFKDVNDMNRQIIDKWNSVVSDEDTVYVLGDVCMGKISNSLPLIKELRGVKHLQPGNHDRCWKGDKKFSDEWVHKYLDAGFVAIHHDFAWAFVNGINIKMSHFPFEGDSQEEDRYKEFRQKQKSEVEFIIHGHVHNAWKVNGRQINVGVDVWDYHPVSHDMIKSIVTIKGSGDHKRSTGQAPTIT